MESTHPKTETQQSEPQLRRFTRDEYYQMGDMGWFEDCQVELLGGEVWEKFPVQQPEPGPYRWTRDQYYQMAELGWFEGFRVELIDGEILQMSPQKNTHFVTISLVEAAVSQAFGSKYWIRIQGPLELKVGSAPEPDIAVVPGNPRDYQDHPTTALLIVEVSDSSLQSDRNRKAGLYAAADIADYWIVNLIDNQLEVFRNPSPDDSQPFGFAYTEKTVYQPDDTITPLAAPNTPVKVADLLL